MLFHVPASAVDVWLVVPLLLQPTTAPTLTRSVSGENWYSVMVTVAVGGGGGPPIPPLPPELDPPHAANTASTP